MNSQPGDIPETTTPALGQRTTEYTIAGAVAGILFPIIASLIKMNELGMPITLANMFSVQQIEHVLWITDTAPFFLGLVAGVAGSQQDRLLQANQALQERESELTAIRSGLEENISQRTQELDVRNREMRSVITFARQIAEIQDLPALLATSVEIIHERFPQYEADVLLLEETGQAALLRASSSALGKSQVQGGLRTTVGEGTLVGRSARRGKMATAGIQLQNADGRLKKPTGPLALPEIALPLTVRGRVIGVLDLHPRTSEPIPQSEAEILQLVADQLAAAVESARLATQSRMTVEQLEALTAEATRTAWRQYLHKSALAYQYTPAGVRSMPADQVKDGSDGMTASLMLRGQQIGSIALRRADGRSWAPNEQDLLKKVATQVALALENVRLLEETRQRAAQEQIVSEISARFSRSLDVDALLQAAVREFAALPDVAEATVLLKPADEQAFQAGN